MITSDSGSLKSAGTINMMAPRYGEERKEESQTKREDLLTELLLLYLNNTIPLVETSIPTIPLIKGAEEAQHRSSSESDEADEIFTRLVMTWR